MEAKLDMVLEQVGRDKNIDKSVLINALEQAILTAAKRTFGLNREMEAKFNPESGSVDLFLIVAQTAKQVIYQRVREAERDNVFNEFKDRKGEIISGVVRRFERGALVVDIGKAEAVLPMREQVPRESYRVGD